MSTERPHRPHVAFVLEQTLGHVTHTDNLRRLVPQHDAIEATFLPVEFGVEGVAARVPGFGNWTVRAGLRARRAVRRARRRRPIDAMFVHTQVPAILMPDVVKRIPTVVSLDATPRQYDQLGEHYAHETSGPRIEQWKWRANRLCFERAIHIVTWAEWTKQGLVDEYGIDSGKITVIAPGVDPSSWTRPTPRPDGAGAPVRILFVGGDLQRKGGTLLLESFRALRDEPSLPPVELHLVTRSALPDEEGVVVHRGMEPNSRALIDLYHRCDVFCLPTLGDCLPMVLSEAGAAGLPLVSTDVGAIHEIVREDDTGRLVAPGDGPALTAALRDLVTDGPRRRRLGERAAALVADRYDASKNAAELVALLAECASRTRR
jgi:glycosyltransferase involved in cell wall biosynthesis